MIDEQEKQEWMKQFLERARHYVPEWNPDCDETDAGLTLACIFCDYMLDTEYLLNRAAKKYKYEFFRRMGAVRKDAVPARGMLRLQSSGSDAAGTDVRAGSIFRAKAESGDWLEVRTQEDCYVSRTRISGVFRQLHDGYYLEYLPVADGKVRTFISGENQQENRQTFEIYIGHSVVTDMSEDMWLDMKITEDISTAMDWTFSYSGEDGFVPFSKTEVSDHNIRLYCDASSVGKYVFQGQESFWIRGSSNRNLQMFRELPELISASAFQPAQILLSDEADTGAEVPCYPFGKQLKQELTFYIGHSYVLSKKNTQIRIRMEGVFHEFRDPGYEEEAVQYKWVMRKSSLEQKPVYRSEISHMMWEYFNGTGWARLSVEDEEIFQTDEADTWSGTVTFICPEDIEEAMTGAYENFFIRMRITGVSSPDQRNKYHRVPYIHKLELAHTYEPYPQKPELAYVHTNMEIKEYGMESRYTGKDSCYLCFEQVEKCREIRILFLFDGMWQDPVIQYLSSAGWEPLVKTREATRECGTACYTICFAEDAVQETLFSQEGFWINLEFPEECDGQIRITDIHLHAVLAEEILRNPEEEQLRQSITEGIRFKPFHVPGYVKEAVAVRPFQGGRIAESEDACMMRTGEELFRSFFSGATGRPLPEVRISTSTFTEIMEQGRKSIAIYQPEWTDYNHHDPGITILELFAWMKEIQIYIADQVNERHEKKFLKLLGEKPLEGRAASAAIRINTEHSFYLPAGTRCRAGNVVFETTGSFRIGSGSITMPPRNAGRWYPFGSAGDRSRSFVFGITALPVPGEIYRMHADVEEFESIGRNPAAAGYDPGLAAYVLEVLTADGWKKAEILKDETYGLIQSGGMEFSVCDDMIRIQEAGADIGLMRFRLTVHNYDYMPVLRDLYINVAAVSQEQTWSRYIELSAAHVRDGCIRIEQADYLTLYGRRCIYAAYDEGMLLCTKFEAECDVQAGTLTLYIDVPEGVRRIYLVCTDPDLADGALIYQGSGRPDQVIRWEQSGAAGEERIAELVVAVEEEGGWHIWEQKDDLMETGPKDRCFQVASDRQGIFFGDGVRGRCPTGSIRMFTCVTSLFGAGNISADKINILETEQQDVHIAGSSPSEGGREQELVQDSFRRIREKSGQGTGAQSDEDYAAIACRTPGLCIRACASWQSDDGLKRYLAVRPGGEGAHPELNQAYKAAVHRWMEPYRQAGTELYILPPVYIRTALYIEAQLAAEDAEASDKVAEVVRTFFSQHAEGFGRGVSYKKLWTELESHPYIEKLKNITIEAYGTAVERNEQMDVIIPANGWICLETIEYL